MTYHDVHYSLLSLTLEKVVENRQVISSSDLHVAFRFRIESCYLSFEIVSV